LFNTQTTMSTEKSNFNPAALRQAFGSFATGVTVITALDASGKPTGITVNSFTSVSLEPPLVLWCIGLGTPSFASFRDCSHYAIHVLSADQEDISNRFANPSADKFAGLDYSRGTGGVPLLPGCVATFECSNAAQYPGGDHLILVGKVEHYQASLDAPLLFFASNYAHIQP